MDAGEVSDAAPDELTIDRHTEMASQLKHCTKYRLFRGTRRTLLLYVPCQGSDPRTLNVLG